MTEIYIYIYIYITVFPVGEQKSIHNDKHFQKKCHSLALSMGQTTPKFTAQ